jgi:dTDP-4-dehydrorhamnose 3,5-epimerase
MKVHPTKLDGVLVVEPQVFGDPRGFFMETYQQTRYMQANVGVNFVQDNVSSSVRHTLRGLHFQHPHDQDKLVYVLQGEIFDVAVDIRRGSPTFGGWVGQILSEENHYQLFIPRGFAHGFCVLSQTALFCYKCSDYYAPGDEGGIIWNDPDLGIAWPVEDPILSPRDKAYSRLKEISPDRLPTI